MKEAIWLTTAQAAAHLGFVDEHGQPNVRAFTTWKWRMAQKRTPVATHRIRGSRSLRYRQVDLDRCVEPERQVIASLEDGARHLRMVR